MVLFFFLRNTVSTHFPRCILLTSTGTTTDKLFYLSHSGEKWDNYIFLPTIPKKVISQTKQKHKVEILSPPPEVNNKATNNYLENTLSHKFNIFTSDLFFLVSYRVLEKILATSKFLWWLPSLYFLSIFRVMKETTVGIMRSDQAHRQICDIVLGLTSLQLLIFSFSFLNHYSLGNLNWFICMAVVDCFIWIQHL